MAKAEPKKRRGRKPATTKAAKAADTKAAEPKAARAKTGVVNGERQDAAPSSVKPETIEHHAAKIFTKRRELDKHTEEGGEIRAELSDARKKAKKDGVNLDVINDIYEMTKQDISVTRRREQDKRRYLSILKPETAKQLDMFVDTKLAAVDPDADGYAAYKNNEPQTNNPFRAGTGENQQWDGGWMRAQVENISTMGPNGSAGSGDDFVEDATPPYQRAGATEATIQ